MRVLIISTDKMITLTERQRLILSLIIHEHTRTALPVGSKSLAEQYGLQMSSATIRNEMAALTDLGYLRQPHTSAGRVPTEDGYRFFVSNLVQQTTLPATTRNTISHQFYQSRQDIDQWLRLAASVLANQSQAASIVTAPHSDKARFKHLELVSTRGRQVLMVMVLVGGEIRQQLLTLPEPITQEGLSRIAAQISDQCHNCSVDQLDELRDRFDVIGNQILSMVQEELNLSEKLIVGEVYLDGMTNVLLEPEFAESGDARVALRLFEERNLLDDLLSRTVMTSSVGGVQVLIGGENTWDELRQCSVILARYGVPDTMTGTLGVLGPMRMSYGNAISTVRFVAGLLSDLVSDTLVE